MSISYLDDAGDYYAEGEPCPNCGSEATLKDQAFGFWKCEDCSTLWGKDADDPDYDEPETPDLCRTCWGHGTLLRGVYDVLCEDCGGSGYTVGDTP